MALDLESLAARQALGLIAFEEGFSKSEANRLGRHGGWRVACESRQTREPGSSRAAEARRASAAVRSARSRGRIVAITIAPGNVSRQIARPRIESGVG
jgi:hypothetical protein